MDDIGGKDGNTVDDALWDVLYDVVNTVDSIVVDGIVLVIDDPFDVLDVDENSVDKWSYDGYIVDKPSFEGYNELYDDGNTVVDDESYDGEEIVVDPVFDVWYEDGNTVDDLS